MAPSSEGKKKETYQKSSSSVRPSSFSFFPSSILLAFGRGPIWARKKTRRRRRRRRRPSRGLPLPLLFLTQGFLPSFLPSTAALRGVGSHRVVKATPPGRCLQPDGRPRPRAADLQVQVAGYRATNPILRPNWASIDQLLFSPPKSWRTPIFIRGQRERDTRPLGDHTRPLGD